MKILYDHQTFTLQKFGGISRYFYELVNELDKVSNIEPEISLLLSNNHFISDYKFTNHFNLFSNSNLKGKFRVFNYLNKMNTISKLKKQNFDIFHPTYYDPYFLKYLEKKPFVLTVYDMIHEKFQDTVNDAKEISLKKKLLIEKASKIITISQNTKNDLIKILGTDEKKINVVYLGNSINPNKTNNVKFKTPKKYLLFIGSRNGYKNFDKFIRSINEILKNDKELNIVCVGGGRFNKETVKYLQYLELSNQVMQYNSDDKNLNYFYKNALAFVFPSHYEGFGIPVLESFTCGCPVICSNTSSLPEIAEDGAYFFDPTSEMSIRDSVQKVIVNSNLRKDLINKGLMQVKKFSWEKTAAQTNEIYKSILK